MRIINFLLLLLISTIPLFGLSTYSFKIISWVYIGSVLFLLFCSYLWRKHWARLFSCLFLLIWTANASISFIMWLEYKSNLDVELAITVLSTNSNEIFSFFLSYWEALPVSVVCFALALFTVIQVSRYLSNKFLFVSACLFMLIPGYKLIELVCKPRLHDKGFLFSEKVLPYTSLVNVATFMRGMHELTILQTISTHVPEYHLSTKDKGIDTYIIVIGESVRRSNMSLYSYGRDTTPTLLAQKNNLLVFEQAIAPAPITMLSVAHTLSRKEINDTDNILITDNIVNLANAAGFETYWFSVQGKIGRHSTMITAIANASQHKKWIDGSEYDSAVFQELTHVLLQPSDKKRLIVIHTNGSHSLACRQYPESEHYLTDGESYHADCYDNSIRYLDKLLGSLFTEIDNKKASVLYFSDHGQIKRKKYNDVDYVHDAIDPEKQAVEVPQFIWFSPAIDEHDRKIGSVKALFSLSDNYYLIYDWLGISLSNEENSHSPLNNLYEPRKPETVKVIDSHGDIYPYLTLSEGN